MKTDNQTITSNEQLREKLKELIPTVSAKSKLCDIINKFKFGRSKSLKVDTLFKIAQEFNLNVEVKISKHEPVNNKQA